MVTPALMRRCDHQLEVLKAAEGYHYECGLSEDFNDMVKCASGGGKPVGF